MTRGTLCEEFTNGLFLFLYQQMIFVYLRKTIEVIWGNQEVENMPNFAVAVNCSLMRVAYVPGR